MVEKNNIHDEDDVIATDEILPEDIELDAEGEEVQVHEKLKKLREKLALSEVERRTCLEDLQRVKADFLNSRRRLEEQFMRDKERASDKILLELLTLIDSFDTAMADKTLWDTVDEHWRGGVEAIYSKLVSILKSNNVVPIDPQGLPFNPEEHEAVSNTPVTDDADVERVMTVLQKGFKRNDTIIRPARVIVGTK